MRRWTTSVAAMFLLATLPLIATSTPSITGNIAGIELCEQAVCGVAAFAGNFIGEVKSKPTSGVFWAGINHDPLPEAPGDTANITGGTWLIRTSTRTFSGVIENGGTLLNNGGNTFIVTLTMTITSGGRGSMSFTGVLDHNPFPPTIIGSITQ